MGQNHIKRDAYFFINLLCQEWNHFADDLYRINRCFCNIIDSYKTNIGSIKGHTQLNNFDKYQETI